MGVFLLTFFLSSQLLAQSRACFTPTAPPTQASYNGWSYGFKRGLYVDCVNDLIQDMKNGNFSSEQALQNYVSANFIDQLVLFGLDNSVVVGNPNLEPTLKLFLSDMRAMFPGIQLGAAASSKNFLNDTDPFLLSSVVHEFCEDGPQGKTVIEIEDLMNHPHSARERQEAEMLKSVGRLSAFSGDNKGVQSTEWEVPETCLQGFDFLFIEVEYWTGATVVDKNLAYNNLKDCLYLGQKLKCKFNCLRNIDAEFNPRDIAAYNGPQGNYSALSRTTQIKQCDALMDQVMLVNYVTPDHAAISFDYKCDVLKEFADITTKKHSQIIIANSAEKAGFVDCHGTTLGISYLGGYLDGTDPFFTGNMYSVEQDFVTLMENPAYVCPNCACQTFVDNHFANTNQYANEIVGSVWFASSFMMDQNLSRLANRPIGTQPVSISFSTFPSSFISEIKSENGNIEQIAVFDLTGKEVLFQKCNSFEVTIDKSSFRNGIYQLNVVDSNHQLHLFKYVVVK